MTRAIANQTPPLMDDDSHTLEELVRTPQLLARIANGTGTELQLQSALREEFSPELVRAGLLLHDLRRRARAKFTRAEALWLDRTGLEQATPEPVARHKAQRFAGASAPVYDLCCGIGADAIALAGQGCDVIAVDQSSVACLRTQLNAAAYGVADRIQTLVADVTTLDIPHTLIHIDPDRRAGSRRALRLEDYAPPLEFLQSLPERFPGGAIKLSPASNFGGKFPDCEIELTSRGGECKEATVWFGSLAGAAAMRATVLPAGFSLAGNPWEARPRVGPLQRFVYDPDPAIVRAGLLDQLTEQLELQRLDDAEEYLTSERLSDSPAVRAFEVLAELPHNDRAIRNDIRERGLGELEIKCRHVPVDIEALRRKLPLTGKDKAVLIIARLQGKTRALICRRQ
jgi:SAM-dependent methyltransferase